MEQRILTPNEQLLAELKKIGFNAEICKDFLVVKYTPQKPNMGYSINGLELRFERKLVVVNRTETGFYLAFQP